MHLRNEKVITFMSIILVIVKCNFLLFIHVLSIIISGGSIKEVKKSHIQLIMVKFYLIIQMVHEHSELENWGSKLHSPKLMCTQEPP